MKTSRISFDSSGILALLALAVHFSAPASALADNAATEALLVSKPWTFTFDKGWTITRVFYKSGVYATSERPDQTGHWKISGNTLTLTGADNSKDVLVLPLNPAGTTGVAKDGETIKAAHAPGAPAAALNATPPPDKNLNEQEKAAITTALASGQWKISGLGWTSERVFARDGTFTTPGHTDLGGHWKFVKNWIAMVFTNGHQDLVYLPIDPQGTPGADQYGRPMTLTIDTTTPVEAVAATPTPANPFAVAAPAAPLTDSDKAASIAVLVSGPWKITKDGGGWSTVRIFNKNGVFTTPSATNETGKWKISGNVIFLTFPDGHKDTIKLPVNAKGTPGGDSKGEPVTCVLVGAE